ncbi:MAG TPA: hypothetical protein VGM30_00410 [Puia sp.]
MVSPIQAIGIDGRDYTLPAAKDNDSRASSTFGVLPQSIALRLKQSLDDIRYGRQPDPYGWNFIV